MLRGRVKHFADGTGVIAPSPPGHDVFFIAREAWKGEGTPSQHQAVLYELDEQSDEFVARHVVPAPQ